MDPANRNTLRTVLARVRPWCLRAAALLRLGVVVATVPAIVNGGALRIALAAFEVGCAAGLWRRMVWPWRLALLVDVVLVIVGAVTLLETDNLALFEYIAGGVTVDVILLSFGQGALDLGVPVPQ